MNKRKKVAIMKHRQKARKAEAKKLAAATNAPVAAPARPRPAAPRQ